MSIEVVKEEIARFLNTNEPEVLCITGKWGVGKTFGWNRYLIEAQCARRIALEKYSYVSLFGLNSLDDLKYGTFESTVPVAKIGDRQDASSLASSLKTLPSLWRRGLHLLGVIPNAQDVVAGIRQALFFAVRDQIVCFDDLERAGTDLQLKNVLGMISFLKEQRHCKVVLLLNDEELAEDARKTFRSQLEKVVDTRVAFEPTPQEAANIAVTPGTIFRQRLCECCVELGIVNIRVIKKIERWCTRLAEELKDYDEGVLRQAVHTATLLAWIHYQPDSAPPIEFVKKLHLLELDLITEKREPTEQEKTWRALLQAYSFGHVDEFDAVVLAGIEAGHIDRKELRAEAAVLHKKLEHQKKDNSFTEAWSAYHRSFQPNTDEVLDKMAVAFRQSVDVITPLNLDATVTLFKDLGRPDQAKELLEVFMERRQEDRKFFDLKRDVFGDVKDTDVAKAFAEKAAAFEDKRDPATVLINIAEQHGWNEGDLALLTPLTPDDFHKMFSEYRGDRLHRLVQGALQFGSIGNASEDMKRIASNATEALRKIAGESPINARRVRAYGVAVDNTGD